MNRKVLTAAIVLLMVLGTILTAVPVHAVVDPLPVLSSTSGTAESRVTVTAPGAAAGATTYFAGHDVFVLFDREVADADLGAPLYAFGALAGPPACTEKYVPAPAGWPAVYVPGAAIYCDLPGPGVGVVSVGDIRETPVTASAATGAQTYAAGSTVAAGDADIGTALAAAFPGNTMHTAVSAAAAALGFNWHTDGIYIRDPSNIVAGFNDRVGPGDLRAKYPSVTVTLTGTSISATYSAWTKVYSPSFDFQKPIYNHAGGAGVPQSVVQGDTRLRNVVIPQVRYAPGSFVLTGSQDQLLGFATTAFSNLAAALPGGYEAFADTNNNGVWDPGESIYRLPGAGLVFPGFVTAAAAPNQVIRLSYVTGTTAGGAAFSFMPLSLVVAGDPDINTPIRLFPATQRFYDADASTRYSPLEWIYNQPGGAAALVPCPGAVTTCVAGTHSQRASLVDFTDKGMAATAGQLLPSILPATWALDWSNVVGYPVGSGVAFGDSDVGRPLTGFAATDKHTGGAPYVSGARIYRDNDGDNLISVGDTREVLISRLAAGFGGRAHGAVYPWLGRTGLTATPPVADDAFWYMPGTTVVGAPTADADALGTALVNFAATEYYYDQFNDGAYLGSDLVAHAGTNVAGNVQPFPVQNAAGLDGPVPIPFTVPINAPTGNHAVIVIDDWPANGNLLVNFLNAGFDAAPIAAPGGTYPFESLPWFVGNAANGGGWTTGPNAINAASDFNGGLPPGANAAHAGPAFFLVSRACAVQMSPGVYAHTLGTLAAIVESDYTKSSIIQNSTGDISLDVTLCSDASTISIYIPPEFTFLKPDTTSVWTSITNDYGRISIDKLGSNDPIGPSWWNLRIVNGTIPIGNYVVRMFNLRAPEVCGRYFVKVFIDRESIGAENFPTIVVKGDLYPAYISGRVLNGGLAGHVPVTVPGKVVAEGTTATGKAITAQAYFNASATGAYVIYGLAAGTYNLTASAAGFAPETLNGTVSVSAGQSLEGVDIYVEPSATISGSICSKCGVGAIPWGSAASRPISIEMLDSNLQSIAWIATNATNPNPSQVYYPFSFNGAIELDGHVPQDHADYVSGLAPGDYYLKAYVNGYLQMDVVAVHVYEYSRTISVPFDLWRSSQFSVTVHFVDVTGSASPTPNSGTLLLEAYAVDGAIEGYNTTSVPKGSYDATMMIMGRNYGLPSGTYFIEASFPGYSQASFPQATLGGGCSTTSLSFNMVRGGLLYLTLRSVDSQTPPQNVPWEYPNATIRIDAIGSQQVYSGIAQQESSPLLIDKGTHVLYVAFANITDLPPDTYLIRAYTVGYIQTKDYQVSMSFGGTIDIQIDLVEATRLNVTLTFRKEGLVAPIDTYARYNSKQVPVRIEVYDSSGILAGANATQIPTDPPGLVWPSVEVFGFRNYAGNPTVRWVNYYDATDGSMQNDYGLPPGTYQVFVWVPGYIQAQPATFTAPLNPANVTLDLYFDRLAHVNGTVGGLDMYDNLIPLSWATVSAYGPTLVTTSSLDGVYEMWMPNGAYTLGVSYPGYVAQGVQIQVSMGSETAVDFNLSPTGTTTPELPTAEMMLPVVLAMVCVACYLHGYRRRTPG